MWRSEVRLRRPPVYAGRKEEQNYESYGPNEELHRFFKFFKVDKTLRVYLEDVNEVVDVRQLVEHREEILERANRRAQKFSANELRQLLENASDWTDPKSPRASEYGLCENSPCRRQDGKQWRRSLECVKVSSHLVRFLKRRDVRSRDDLLARAKELVEEHKMKARKFSLRELEELLEEFGRPALPACRASECDEERPPPAERSTPPFPPARAVAPNPAAHPATNPIVKTVERPPSPQPSYYQEGVVNMLGDGNKVSITMKE